MVTLANIGNALYLFDDFAPLLLRVGLCVVFMVHGYPKLFTQFQGTKQFFESIGLRPSKLWVLVVGSVEFFGGIALLFGFVTQLAALLVAIDMLVAMFLVKFRQGFVGGWEFDFILFLAALSLVLLGGGAWSVDRFLRWT